MYIAQTTIETAAGTFRAGEAVKGLSEGDVRRMSADGYIETVAEEVPKAASEETLKATAPEELPKAAGGKRKRRDKEQA